jgi:cytochrome c
MKRLPIIFPLLVMIAATGSLARAQDMVSHGQALVAEFCGRCHAVGTKGKSRHPDAPPFRILGHPDMPEFKFSHEDARAVRGYLRAIQQ